jgi:hypothetical protein
MKYYGNLNDYLLIFSLVVRVYFMVKYTVNFYFTYQVKLRRVLRLMGIVNI